MIRSIYTIFLAKHSKICILYILFLYSCHRHGWDHDHVTIYLSIVMEGNQSVIHHKIPGSILPGFERPVQNSKEEAIWQEKISEFQNNISNYIRALPESKCNYTLEGWTREEDGHHLDTLVDLNLNCKEPIQGFIFDFSSLKGIENIYLKFPDNPSLDHKYRQNKLEWKP